jgi:hypothetical protein
VTLEVFMVGMVMMMMIWVLRPYRLVDRYSNFGKKHIVSIFKAEVVMP